ncbi:MAG: hypothetical protein PHR44_04790 [Candidatus Omnitrophica bacterium]|nr:hypothetical protein [Candidatus Omnitrophota bacterium]
MKKDICNIRFITTVLLLTSLFAVFSYAEDASSLIPQISYAPQSSRDPFKDFLPVKRDAEEQVGAIRGQAEAAVQLPAMKLQGVIWEGRIPQAIIDNGVFTVGDKINEAEIKSIDREGLTLLYKGQVFLLPSPARVLEAESLKKQGGEK